MLSADAVKVREGARMILEHWGGDRPLEATVRLVEPGGFTKISALGVEEQRVYVVGDSPWDAIAAGRLGVRTLGVLCGGFPEAELRKAGCIAIYRDPADLLARLDESPIVR